MVLAFKKIDDFSLLFYLDVHFLDWNSNVNHHYFAFAYISITWILVLCISMIQKKSKVYINFVWIQFYVKICSKFNYKEIAFDRWRTGSHRLAWRWGKEANRQAIAGRWKESSVATENILQLYPPSMCAWKGFVHNNKIWSSTICKAPCFYLFLFCPFYLDMLILTDFFTDDFEDSLCILSICPRAMWSVWWWRI